MLTEQTMRSKHDAKKDKRRPDHDVGKDKRSRRDARKKQEKKIDAKLEETKGDPITMSGKIRDPIRASIGEGSGQVPKKGGIRASTG